MNLTCSVCGSSAVLSIKENGETDSVCDSCVRKRAPYSGFPDFIGAFKRPARPTKVCPYCEITEEKVVATGLVGCPLCYVALESAVELVLKSVAAE